MLVGLLMLITPAAVFVFTLPLSRRLRPGLRKSYRIVGALLVFPGSVFSLYLASYSGDQGGIAAFYFQSGVILAYLAISLFVIVLNWILRAGDPSVDD